MLTAQSPCTYFSPFRCILWVRIRQRKSKLNLYRVQEQENMSFTVRLSPLIFQQYKIGFKVELQNIKVSVEYNGKYKADECVSSISRRANGANSKYGK